MSDNFSVKVSRLNGQLVVPIPQDVINFLGLTDESSVDFCLGDALVTLWKSSDVRERALTED